MMKNKQIYWVSLLILFILVVDQMLKVWVKTHFQLHESLKITSWFYLTFVENNGMAFGMELTKKIVLTLFRIGVAGWIGVYLWKIVKQGTYPTLSLLSIALIFAGAVGNIIDSVFYGVIFNDSVHQLATLFPPEGGYSTWFYGKVVDMFYFPLIESTFPQWLPFWGGEDFVFFQPVFNIADSAISVGVGLMILSYSSFSKAQKAEKV